MKTRIVIAAVTVLAACAAPRQEAQAVHAQSAATQGKQYGSLDQLLAPVALYPDSLLAQMLMSAADPPKITELDKWLKDNQKLKGTALFFADRADSPKRLTDLAKKLPLVAYSMAILVGR